ncbi:MAG: hypothetical protein CL666_14695 [Balneola sp.]|nr:hypothetical protein [Balneola sp.]|tara:strand:+ start:7453 stop:7956 length:504 start_codon:yes stop_codon:yes gene_type:complete
MTLYLVRFSSGADDTLGILFLNGEAFCFTLEDEWRSEKVAGETRIPDGEYEIELRQYGGFHNRYKERFGTKFHKGMLELKHVPGFTDILIHCGNNEEHTAGCILVGDTVDINRDTNGYLGRSTEAYLALYEEVINAIQAGEDVEIIVTDDVTEILNGSKRTLEPAEK